MEEKTGRKLEFDIKIVFLNEMVDTTEIGNTLFPIKEKIRNGELYKIGGNEDDK